MSEKILYNNPHFLERRRQLRRDQTDAEKLLWRYLRGRQLENLKFFRQYSVGPYILDFYCPNRRLGIELDGGQRDEAYNREYDEIRSAYLKSQGIDILRFWNNVVMKNSDGVLEEIRRKVLTQPSPNHNSS